MQRVPEMAERKGAAPAPVLSVQWQYRVATIEELDVCGKAGWEAVGVWTDPAGVPHVLMEPEARGRLDRAQSASLAPPPAPRMVWLHIEGNPPSISRQLPRATSRAGSPVTPSQASTSPSSCSRFAPRLPFKQPERAHRPLRRATPPLLRALVRVTCTVDLLHQVLELADLHKLLPHTNNAASPRMTGGLIAASAASQSHQEAQGPEMMWRLRVRRARTDGHCRTSYLVGGGHPKG